MTMPDTNRICNKNVQPVGNDVVCYICCPTVRNNGLRLLANIDKPNQSTIYFMLSTPLCLAQHKAVWLSEYKRQEFSAAVSNEYTRDVWSLNMPVVSSADIVAASKAISTNLACTCHITSLLAFGCPSTNNKPCAKRGAI